MKNIKINSTVLTLALCMSSGAYAAVVSTYTPEGINPISYDVVSGETPDLVYSNLTLADHTALVDASYNGGEELVYLGLHTPFSFAAGNVFTESNQVTVNLNNQSGSASTGGISLVLSALAAVDWTINVQAGVQLNDVYVFSGTATNRNNSNIFINGSAAFPTISAEDVCGYSLPQDTDGCLTNNILGLDDPTYGPAVFNFLADLTSLKVTNFNGTYYANQFDIAVDTTVVPIPASMWLLGSALFALVGQKYSGKK